ncbi:NADP-dependent oxidoreductase [Cellulomonas sp. Leaf395]|uniref:NADP-dependent oxidoreductase n=1 Tax=Cellulomonas sp. Leaf395 TaxID=1736362 RepID=UPI00070005E0|nr:NADP-dependent oxidoreductase [Cellulomonas sp. Leaf395]KQS98651.1 NADPH:quinone reductase [Cellulomonas sp. Leaf395]
MKAIIIDTFGGPEVLRSAEVPVPEPGPGQVRVRVVAAGVNGIDGKLRAGVVPGADLPAVLGIEVAGVVDALGTGIDDVRVGDTVVGWADPPAGGYAELALASTYAPVPPGLEPVDAVTVPVAGETALRVLRELAVQPGETLLVHGASGSVGELATQLALARGVHVVGTASPDHQARVAALGATPTTYGPGLVDRVRAAAPQGVDAVLDTTGRGVLPDSVELRGGTERIITIADPAAFALGIAFSSAAQRSVPELADLLAQRARGELTTTMGGVFPLADVRSAAELNDAGRGGGKLVLIP